MSTNQTEDVGRLYVRLDAQWSWFDANPEHDETEHKTDIFMRTLRRYIAAYDAWDAAENGARRCR